MEPADSKPITLGGLLRKLAPLSFSDVVMALGDPLQTMTLARLPQPEVMLAVTGIVKSVASFLESPVLMVLHASTALGKQPQSRQALKHFVIVMALLISAIFVFLGLGPIYEWLMLRVFGATPEVARVGWTAFMVVVAWPALIAWRRYFQGLLILSGQGRWLGTASLGRLLCLVAILGTGLWMGVQGALLAAVTMIGGVAIEAGLVTLFAYRCGALEAPPVDPKLAQLPSTTRAVAVFYFPLAAGMLLTYLGRSCLLSVVSRAPDGPLALACWPATWGFVVMVANASRMVQQIVIAHASQVPARLLFTFATLAGGFLSLILMALGFTPAGENLLGHMLGGAQLVPSMLGALQVCTLLPLFIAWQNAIQGYYVVHSRTWAINRAGAAGVAVTLVLVTGLVFLAGMAGATAAAWATMGGLAVELTLLASSLGKLVSHSDAVPC